MTESPTAPGEGPGTIPRPRPTERMTSSRETGPWMGWVRFGGVMMAIIGGFAVIEGIVALLSPTYFVASGPSILVFDLSGWGWVHLILGVLVLATGLSLAGTAPSWARGVGIVLVAINAIVQLAFLPAYPIWSIILIALDVVVLYALMVSWGETAA